MLPVKFQGEDIYHGIRIYDEGKKLVVLDDFTNIIVYLYTDENNILKYSYTAVTGLFKINKITSTLYYFIIESGVTATLAPGNLVMELKVVKPNAVLSDNREDLLVKAEILQIAPSKMLNYSGLESIVTYEGDTSIDITAMSLSGVSAANSNNYTLYWEIVVYNVSSYRFNIYKDAAKTSKVADAGSIDKTCTLPIVGVANSGITGSITIGVNYTLYWAIYAYSAMGEYSYCFGLYKDFNRLYKVGDTSPYNNTCVLPIVASGNSGITGTVSVVAKYKLYWKVVTYQSTQYILHIYKDAAMTIEVAATLPFSTTGIYSILEISGSGITGMVRFSQMSVDDDSLNVLNATDTGDKEGTKYKFSVVVEGDPTEMLNQIVLYDVTGTHATQVLDTDTANKIIMNSLNLDDYTEEGDTNGLLTSIALVGVSAVNSVDLTDKDSLNTITVTP